MSNAQPVPAGEGGPGAEVFNFPVAPQEVSGEMEVENSFSLVLAGMLSPHHKSFIIEQAAKYGAEPYQIVEAALSSYQELSELVEAGGRLFVLGRDGRMHPIPTSEADPPPPAS